MTTPADRAAAVHLVRERIAGGAARRTALQDVSVRVGVPASSLRRWLDRALDGEAGGVGAVEALADRPRPGRPPRAWSEPGAEDAWTVWRGLYLSLAAPAASVCWHRTREIAAVRGWRIPSQKAFLRRLRAELPARDVIRAREGRLAALGTFPFQARSVADLKPLQVVNGDGYVHNLLVVPPGGGRPVRPRTWTWQDVRTRRLLAHRSGPTESADLVRSALWDLCREHGAPGEALVLDNTRAASAQWLGGSTVRWRRDREDAPTVFHSIGIPLRVVRTGVERTAGGRAAGRGWAKPVERAHRDFGDWIDKHPLATGAYTGRDPSRKPENHGTAPVDWETFERIVADDVARLNALPGRRTEACGGTLSFDEAWAREIAETPITRLSAAQLALLLMAAESTAVQRSGAFTLRSGEAIGMGRNRYYHPDLVAKSGQRVVARFDPQRLHDGAQVFDLDGKWLCAARWLPSAGFGDVEAAAEHNRARRAWMRDTDRAHDQRDRAADVYARHAPLAPAPARRPSPKVVRMVPDHAARPDVARQEALRRRLADGLRAVNED